MDQIIDLSSFFATKAQANDFSERLNYVIDNLYTVNFNLEEAISQEFGIAKKDALMALFREQNISLSSKNVVQDFLKKIQAQINNIPVLNLTIAFSPNDETLKILSQWFLLTLNKQVLFDIRVDKTLIGGATIMYDGKYKDYSLKLTFGQTLEHLMEDPKALDDTHKKTVQKPQSLLHQSAEHISIGR